MATEPGINYDDIPELTEEQFKGGVRGKYYKRALAGKTLVRLDPDVAAAFPTEAAVNAALRMLVEVAQHVPAPKPSSADPVRHAFEPGERSLDFS